MKAITIVLPAAVLLGCFTTTLHAADSQQNPQAYRSTGSLPIAAPAAADYPHHQGTPPATLPFPLYPSYPLLLGESSSDRPTRGLESHTPPPGYSGGIYPYPPQAGPYGAYQFPPQAGTPGYGWSATYPSPSHDAVCGHTLHAPLSAPTAQSGASSSKKLPLDIAEYLANTSTSLNAAPGELLQALQLFQGARKDAFEKFLALDTANMSAITAELQRYVPANLDQTGSPAGRRKSFAVFGSKEQRAQQALQAQLDAASAHSQSFVDLTIAAGARYRRVSDTAQIGLLTLTGAAASGAGEKASS